MMNYALIEGGVVLNVIVWGGNTETWSPPEGVTAVELTEGLTANIGDTYDGKVFTPAAAPPAPALTQAQIIATYEAALSAALDGGAQAWGYDSIVSAASYAASTNAQFKAEALALIGWRDAVWVWASAQLAAVQGGTQTMPSTPAAFVALMPAQPLRPKT